MNWVRVGRWVIGYAVAYAGGAVLATALLFDGDQALVGLVGLGCFLLLLAATGDRSIRTMVPGSQEAQLFEAGTVEAEDRQGAALSRPLKYVLVGAGLVVGGIAALVLA